MREKILAMEAGRLLDSLIAEDVMGWRDVRSTTNTSNNFTSPQGFPPNEYSRRKILNYSTDISAAWEVEEKFKDTHLQKEYAIQLHNVLGLMLHEPTTLDNIYQFVLATPLQRCKAALLAVMET